MILHYIKLCCRFVSLFNFQGTLPKPFGFVGGDEEDRTPDPLRARQVLSQLSYTPILTHEDFFSPRGVQRLQK